MPTDRFKVSGAAVSAANYSCLPSAFTTRAQDGSAALTALKNGGSAGVGKMQSIEWARKVTCSSCKLIAYMPPHDEIESIGWCSIRREGKPFRDICQACWRIEAELREVR